MKPFWIRFVSLHIGYTMWRSPNKYRSRSSLIRGIKILHQYRNRYLLEVVEVVWRTPGRHP